MAATAGSRIVSLALRVFANILLFISLIVLCTNVETWSAVEVEIKFEFIKTALSIYNTTMKSDRLLLLDFHGDKFVSCLLLTGAAAGFGETVDGKETLDALGVKLNTFYEKANASASLLLLACVCTAALSILSSLALPKSIRI